MSVLSLDETSFLQIQVPEGVEYSLGQFVKVQYRFLVDGEVKFHFVWVGPIIKVRAEYAVAALRSVVLAPRGSAGGVKSAVFVYPDDLVDVDVTVEGMNASTNVPGVAIVP